MKPKRRSVLFVESLGIWRGETTMLSEVNWRIEPGEHWAILGANGSGKTSLLSALTGYLTPSAGEILLLGRRYGRSDWRELRKKIGLVSSSISRLMPEDEPALETVIAGKYAQIDLWGRTTKTDRQHARRLLDQVDCGYLADRPWIFLSQGERQRMLIARALMARPRLLILDEPCAGLDPVAREHFLQFLDRLAKSRNSPTLVLVTHHVEEVLPVFTHVLLLRAGRVQAAGERQRVLTAANLSRAFGAGVKLHFRAGRYAMRVARTRRAII